MRLTSELTVDAPLERTWAAVLGLGGPVRVDLGTEYQGAARLDDVDEDEHKAGFYAQARETTGHGLAAATIAAHLSEAGGATRIAVHTDMRLMGDSRPGQEALQAAAEDLLARVGAYLERRVEQTVPRLPAAEPAVEPGEAPGSDPSLARELTRSEPPPLKGPDPFLAVAERALLVVAGVAVGLALGRAVWRGR